MIGDSFVGATADHYFQRKDVKREFYMKENYETMITFNNKHFDPCMLSRIRNVLAKAIGDKEALPKVIVLVLDNDLIRFADHDYCGYSHLITKYTVWLAMALSDMITDYKAKLPKKAKYPTYPKILWVESPLHENFEDNLLRKKYNRIL